MKKAAILHILILVTLTGCDLFKSSVNQTEQLPAATQEGKNTFGCRLNGKVWLPMGNNGTVNLDASYDPTFAGGALDISAYRIDQVTQFIAFGGKDIAAIGVYPLSQTTKSPGAYVSDHATNCFYDDPSNVVSGSFTLTKLDLTQQVVSGLFEFVLAKPNCDTVRVTEGRFDLKF